ILPPGVDKKPAADTLAAKPAPPPRTNAGGIVKAVNAEQRSITIDDKGTEYTFTLAHDACVSVDGQPGKLADIPNGAHVIMDLTAEQAARNLSAQGRSLYTSVTAVDVAQRRFTLKEQNGDKTFPVCSKA